MVVRELVTKLGFKVDTKKVGAFESRIEGVKKKAAGASSKFGSFGKAIGDSIMNMNAGTIAFGAAGLAVAGVAKFVSAATQKYLAFEEGMKGVERVTLATAEEMKRMEKAALEAGEASIFSTADSANAMKFLAQAGLEVDEVITALPGALQLAAAANMDLATAADISTNILTSNKLSVEELTRVNDVLAKTASKTNTDVIQLGWAFAELGNVGKLAGLEIEELSSFFGVLANNGVRGSNAGTTLKNSLMALLSPTKKGSALLKELNIDMNDYVDSTGKFKKGKLPELFGQLNKAFEEGKLGPGKMQKAFQKLPSKGLITFASTGKEKLEELTEAFKNAGGTAEKAANIAFKGLGGAIKLLGSRIDVSMVKFMKTSNLNKIFEDIVRFLSDVLPPLIDAIAVMLKPIGKVLRIILFPFKLIGALLGGVVKMFSKTGDAATSILDPLDSIADFLDGIVQSVRDFFSAFNKISIFERVANWIRETADNYNKFYSDLAKSDSFAGKLYRMFINIERIVKSIVDLFGIGMGKELDIIADDWTRFMNGAFAFFDWLIDDFNKWVNGIADSFKWVWEQIEPIVDAILQPIKDTFDLISVAVSEIADLLDIEVAKAKKPGEEIQKTVSKETSKLEQKSNTFNVNAPVTVYGGGGAGTGKAVRQAVVSAFSLELQKIVEESGGI